MTYSIEPRDRIYVKGYGFLFFAKNMGRTRVSKKPNNNNDNDNNNNNNNNNNDDDDEDVEIATHKKRYISQKRDSKLLMN